jgi:hypothetical protein
MIFEERTYTLHAGKTKEYLNRFEHDGWSTYTSTLKDVIGVFYSEVGILNQIVTISAYDSFEQRALRRAELRANPKWETYAASVRPLITRQENRLLIPAPFSPIR